MQVKRLANLILSGLIITAGTVGLKAAAGESVSGETYYRVEGDAIVRHNGVRYHNRPLYGDHRPSVLLAGDRPMPRHVNSPFVCGSMMIGVVRGEKARWLLRISKIYWCSSRR